MKRSATLVLCLSLSSAALAAACGPSTPPASPDGAGTASATPSVAPPDAPTAMPSATPSATPSASADAPKPPLPKGGTPVTPSKMIDEVKKAGVDLTKAPSLAKMPFATKKKIMPLFVKALGMKSCEGCHASGADFKKETRNVKIARGMWDRFVVALRDEKGGPLFCDSCHAGSDKVLLRDNKDAVKAFMHSDYEGKLRDADKKELECHTCHGDPFKKNIFVDLWAIKP